MLIFTQVYGAVSVVAGEFAPSAAEPAPVELLPPNFITPFSVTITVEVVSAAPKSNKMRVAPVVAVWSLNHTVPFTPDLPMSNR